MQAARAADAPPPGGADFALPGATDESRAEAMRYMSLRKSESAIMAAVSVWRTEMLRDLVSRQKFSPEQARIFVDGYLMPEFRARTDELTRMEAEILASRFSADEIRKLEEFIASALGTKFMRMQDDITKEWASAHYAWQNRVYKDAREKYIRDSAAIAEHPSVEN
jgi:hypothetical protein